MVREIDGVSKTAERSFLVKEPEISADPARLNVLRKEH